MLIVEHTSRLEKHRKKKIKSWGISFPGWVTDADQQGAGDGKSQVTAAPEETEQKMYEPGIEINTL